MVSLNQFYRCHTTVKLIQIYVFENDNTFIEIADAENGKTFIFFGLTLIENFNAFEGINSIREIGKWNLVFLLPLEGVKFPSVSLL
ncbi:hypothetical protein Q783_05030 [Carnobacterium inhibens subsp. gilichinskyi]|uniref:Uncharacterized protein n=1 Tax=Carnobacterium inhibens subsp. gilichinskyi TaxID=1266845 RepID=U5SBX5_9LACT|nr:hypothetical protein Q783_05030 [Carnobacterium inhibens subsp. gilichinskyi]